MVRDKARCKEVGTVPGAGAEVGVSGAGFSYTATFLGGIPRTVEIGGYNTSHVRLYGLIYNFKYLDLHWEFTLLSPHAPQILGKSVDLS